MHLSHFSCFLALVITSSVISAKTLNSDIGHPPRNFGELRDALRQLGYDTADELHKPFLSGLSHGVSTASPTKNCVKVCVFLTLLLGDLVSSPGSESYGQQQSAYWSNQQAEMRPACRVLPKHAKGVAAALLVTTFFHCPFAVKSGGHAAFAGASSIQGGLTIDLDNMRTLQISKDKATTYVGPGNRWGDVYRYLSPLNLSVVGGRDAGIGVGGLTLGGGISFFSGRRGWACDGVRNYEVVLANGKITNVNTHSHPDMYFALRGGGNNFGIVTRFDLETFEQGQLWGGSKLYPIALNASIIKAFDNFANNASDDPDAALIVTFDYVQGQYISVNDYEYAKPVVNPPIFREFMKIESNLSTMRISDLTNLTLELRAASPNGVRNTYTTATFKNSPILLSKILEIFVSESKGVEDVAGILSSLVLQPITKPVISYFSKNGGNAMGIVESDGPLILMSAPFMWASAADDTRVYATSNRIIDQSIAAAKELHLDYKFIYQNYASRRQDVFAGYGQKNHARLVKISQKYDPSQIFQTLQPGYFKLKGPTDV
ncbi:hypothetical protein MMC07_006384 [Pseudocyphellaria aurata]|nr:hypothetical protein [Pseudocyphellaria aurata]